MSLAEKLRYLRAVEGQLRGLNRAISQGEVSREIQRESRKTISQPYLSQIENGKRKHLTNATRLLLAKFFKVHPGFLVNDPEGYHTELVSDVRLKEDQLDLWLVQGAERFRRDAALADSLLAVAQHHDSRRCLLLLKLVLETPALIDRLWSALAPRMDEVAKGREEIRNDRA
jgi:transcriptional regulator with XRE-family HTH domain